MSKLPGRDFMFVVEITICYVCIRFYSETKKVL